MANTETSLLQPVLDELARRLMGSDYTLPAKVQTDAEPDERLELRVHGGTIIAYTDDTDIVIYCDGDRGLLWEMRFTHVPAALIAASLDEAVTFTAL